MAAFKPLLHHHHHHHHLEDAGRIGSDGLRPPELGGLARVHSVGSRSEMAGGLHRASRLAGRLIALIAVVHSVVIVGLACLGLSMDPVAAPDPPLAIIAAVVHVVAIGLVAAALTESSDCSSTDMVTLDGLAAAACVLVSVVLWLAGSSSLLTLPCVLLAALLSAAHVVAVLVVGVGVVADDISWTLQRPLAKLVPGAKVKMPKEGCCGCCQQQYGVLQHKLDADELKKLSSEEGTSWLQHMIAATIARRIAARRDADDKWWVEVAGDTVHLPARQLSARDGGVSIV